MSRPSAAADLAIATIIAVVAWLLFGLIRRMRRAAMSATRPRPCADLLEDRGELVDLVLFPSRPDPLLHLLDVMTHGMDRAGLVAGEDQRTDIGMGVGR